MSVHAEKNQSLTDLLQAKPKTVQGGKFYHTRTVLPDILELRMPVCGAHYCLKLSTSTSVYLWNEDRHYVLCAKNISLD
jgi:hypothetical protein